MKAKLSSSFEREYKLNIWKLYAFKFFRGLHFFSAVLIPFFTVWGGISFTEAMILQAIFTFSIFLMEIPTGTIADWLGRKASLVLAGVVGTIAPLVYTSYANFWVFVFAEFLWAVSAALFSGADSALIYDSLKEGKKEKESKKIFGRYGSLGLIGILISAPLGSLIAEYISIPAAMTLTSIPMAMTVLIGLTIKEPKQSKEIEKPKYIETLVGGISYLRKHEHLKVLIFDYVPTAVLSFFMIWTYQVILQSYDVAVGLFGFVHAGIVIGEILVLNNFKFLERICKGKRNYLRKSAILVGVLFLVVALVDSLIVAIIGIFLIGAFGLTRKQLYQSYLNKHIESHNRATVLSAVSMIYNFSMAISNVIFGRIVDWDLGIGLAAIGILIVGFTFFSKIEEDLLVD